jgi:hypothetical protein
MTREPVFSTVVSVTWKSEQHLFTQKVYWYFLKYLKKYMILCIFIFKDSKKSWLHHSSILLCIVTSYSLPYTVLVMKKLIMDVETKHRRWLRKRCSFWALFHQAMYSGKNVKGTQAWNFFKTFFSRNRNLMVPRACNTRFLKIVFDSAEKFDF